MEVKRVTPEEAKLGVASGAMLVCAYESDELFARNHLEGAISLKSFEKIVPVVAKDQEIIFYCA